MNNEKLLLSIMRESREYRALKDALADATAMCRLGTPQDVAEMIALLAEDGARFVTGQVIGVDGGLVI